jgi:hypothetical protein
MCTGDKYRGVLHDRHFRPTHDFTLLVKLIVYEEIWIWLMLEPFSMGFISFRQLIPTAVRAGRSVIFSTSGRR